MPSQQNQAAQINAQSKLVGMVILASLLFLVIGFAVGYKLNSVPLKNLTKNNSNSLQDQFFQNQSALTQGKITKAENRYLIVTNNQGVAKSFELSPHFVVYVSKESSRYATPSSDIKSVQLNKDASLVFQMIDGVYKVLSVSYPTPFTASAKK